MGNINCTADIVRVNAAERPDRVALIEGDRQLTWAALHERAQRVATGLSEAGVGAGDRVAFLDKNGIDHFEVFFGAALLNAVCVDVNWRLAAPEVEFIVNDAAAKVLVAGSDFVPVVDAIEGDLDVGTTLVIGGHDKHPDFREWVDAHEPSDPDVAVDPDDVAFQLYSSGTTGRPKGVMLSNRNLFTLMDASVNMWGMDADSVNLVAMPLFHIGGGGWATAGMYAGATSVILRELDPARVVDLFADHGVTHAFLVPAALQFMLMVPGADERDYSKLKAIVYGASPISEEVLARSVEVFRCDFWQAYGLTETTGAIVNLPPADHDLSGPNRHRLRSCGVAGPDVELRIIDPDTGARAAQGEVGEIEVRSPQVMVGYWNNPEATAEAVDADGWFKTGDAGYLDADGYLYIHDRVKDMIVSGGENVYPAEVENVLMGHPAVADCAVIGVPDDKWGETPKAMVVLSDDVDDQDLIGYCRERLAKFKCPTSVHRVDELPRNPSGKILKKDLRAPFWEGRDRQVG